MSNENKTVELKDEDLEQVLGGVTNNPEEFQRKYEIELGELVPDAYKPVEKNNNLNELDLSRNNILNQKHNIDNNYTPLK